MKTKILLLFLFISTLSFGSSIDFIYALSPAIKKAKEMDRLIFIDFKAKWCKPCKIMERKVFNDDKVADFYNANFVNVQLDEKHNKSLKLKFKIKGYPTLMFMDADGNIIYKVTGGLCDNDFLKVGKYIVFNKEAINKDVTQLSQLTERTKISNTLTKKAQKYKIENFKRFINKSLFLSDLHLTIILENYGNFVYIDNLDKILEEKMETIRDNNKIRDNIGLNYFQQGENLKLSSISKINKNLVIAGFEDNKELKSYLAAYYAFELNMFDDAKTQEKQKLKFSKDLLLQYPTCPDMQFLINTIFYVVTNKKQDAKYYEQLESSLSSQVASSDYFLLHDMYAICLKKNGKEDSLILVIARINDLTKKQKIQFIPTVEDLKNYFE